MDIPHLDSDATTTAPGHSAGRADIRPDGAIPTGAAQKDEPAPSRLLPGLWLATAVALVVAPFLTQFRVRNQSTQAGHSFSVNGWGQWDGVTISHNMRVGILFAAIALLLVVSVVATVAWRRARWPVWLSWQSASPSPRSP